MRHLRSFQCSPWRFWVLLLAGSVRKWALGLGLRAMVESFSWAASGRRAVILYAASVWAWKITSISTLAKVRSQAVRTFYYQDAQKGRKPQLCLAWLGTIRDLDLWTLGLVALTGVTLNCCNMCRHRKQHEAPVNL